MRDELAHIRNQAADERHRVLTAHEKHLESLYARYPKLKENARQIEDAKKKIITMTLAKLRGGRPDSEITLLEARLEQLRHQRAELLKKYNIPQEALEPQWTCRHCQDSGWVYISDGQATPCQCQIARRQGYLRQVADLPARIAHASFAKVNFDLYPPPFRAQAKKIFAYVKEFCDTLQENSSQGLYIHGPTGSGKSYLMGCIANYLSSRMSVKYLVYADFLDSLRATYSSRDSGYSEQQLVDEVRNVGLLLLDDLGVERPTEFSLKNLAQIIDYRYRNCLPLVVTSNFTLEELIQRSQSDLYGERIVWRLSECCSNMLELKGNLRLNL